MLLAERTARYEAEARATGAEALIVTPQAAHRQAAARPFRPDLRAQSPAAGPTRAATRGTRGRCRLGSRSQDSPDLVGDDDRRSTPRGPSQSVGHLPAHLPRERVVIPGPTDLPVLPAAGWPSLARTITETLEVIPRQWKVIQTVREKFTSATTCETITQPPAPFHPDRPWPCRTGAAGHDPGSQVRAALAAEPTERDLCPRGHPSRRLHHGGLGWRLHGRVWRRWWR